MKRSLPYAILSLVVLDLLMMNVGLLVAYYVRFGLGYFEAQQVHSLSDYALIAVLQTICLPLIGGLQGMYRFRRSVVWADEVYSVFTAVSVTVAVVYAITAFVWQEFEPSRLLLAFMWVFCIVLLLFGRLLHHGVSNALRSQGKTIDRALIIGSGTIADSMIERMQTDSSLGYVPVGVLTGDKTVSSIRGVSVLGDVDQLTQLARDKQIDEVFAASPSLSHADILEIVDACRGAKVGIKVYPDVFQIMASEINISDLGGIPVVAVRDLALKGWNLVIKRALDIVVSGAALVILSPLMLLIALVVKITSPKGPVFFVQERVGLDGNPFPTLKFRSMHPDAESKTGPVWAKAGDDRTTAIGKWLRRLSLDELPQFINVLVGDMSVVGPRPERPYFVDQFQQTIPRYWERHSEKAGLTGWAQVNGLRGNTSIEDRTAYDLWYVENWTVWLDIKIMVRTLFVILRDKNAY